MNVPVINGKVAQRPAEASGLAGAVVLIIVRAVGISDPDLIVALGVIVGAVPAAVTWLAGLIRHRPST